MTTVLTVLTKSTPAPALFEVYWSCGKHTQGVISASVVVPDELTPHRHLLAELGALHQLLEVDEVCGGDRMGNAVSITCSFGAVKKLANGKSVKVELVPFAFFLRTRFADCQIDVQKEEDFIDPHKAHSHRSSITVSGPLLSTITFSDGRRVGVTAHALSQYQIRHNIVLASDAFRSLRAAAAHHFTRVSRVTPDEASRHGRAVTVYLCPNGFRLVVVNDQPIDRLITAYFTLSLVTSAHFA